MRTIVTDANRSGGNARGLAVPGVEVLIAALDPPPETYAAATAGARWSPDAAECAEALRDALVGRCGVDERAVHLLLGPATPDMVGRAVAAASDQASSAVLFCFIGPVALTTDGRAYLGARATDPRPDRSPNTALPVDAVVESLGRTSAPARLLMIDGWLASKPGGRSQVTRGFDPGAAGVESDLEFLLGLRSAADPAAPWSSPTRELVRLIESGDPDGPPALTVGHVLGQVGRTMAAARQWTFQRTPSRWASSFPLCDNRAGRDAGAGDTMTVVLPGLVDDAALAHPGLRPPATTPLAPAGGEPRRPSSIAPPQQRAAPADMDEIADTGESECPYPGLEAFDAHSARWFFGRERAVDNLVRRLSRRLEGAGPLVVVGASGAGKSSLLRAGLLPALAADALPGSSTWSQMTMTPTDHPLRELAARLGQAVGMPTLGTVRLEAAIADPRQFSAALGELQTRGSTDSRAVLVVDQFEELFTLCQDETERTMFVQALCAAAAGADADGPAAVIVLGIRADFYGYCAAYPELIEALQTAQVVLGPMSGAEIRKAVTGPAEATGLSLDPGLVELMLDDLGVGDHATHPAADPGSLPLLAHALRTTWQHRTGTAMTVEGYLAAGRLQGAIARTAETVFGSFDAAGQGMAWQLLMGMVRFGDGTDDTRRRVRRDILLAEMTDPALAATVLNALTSARLVTVDADSVQLAHEALLRSWPRLREWIDIDRAGAVSRQQLAEAAEVWDRTGRDPSFLFTGTRLASVQESIGPQPSLGETASGFLSASLARQRDEQRAARRRGRVLIQLVAVLAVLSLLATGATVYSFRLRSKASGQRDRAVSQRIARQADDLKLSDRDLSAQLALVAYREAHTTEARSSVLATRTYTRHSGAQKRAIGTVAYSPNGKLIATGSDDWTVALWDATTASRRTPVAILRGPDRAVKSVAFNRTGTLLAVGSDDRTVRLWDITHPEHPRALGAVIHATGSVYGLAFSPAADVLAVGGFGNTVHLFGVVDPARPWAAGTLGGHRKPVRAIAYSPDGATLAAGGEDGRDVLWRVADPARPVQLKVLPAESDEGPVRAVTFSRDGHSLFSGSGGGVLRVFNVTDPSSASVVLPADKQSGGAAITTGTNITGLAVSPDGKTVVVANTSDQALVYAPTRSSGPLQYLNHGYVTWAVSYSPDGRSVATGAEDHQLRIWEVPGPVISSDAGDFSAGSAARTGHIFATGSDTGQLELWDVADGVGPKNVANIAAHHDQINAISFGRHDTLLATVSDDDTTKLWDVSKPSRPTLLASVKVPDARAGEAAALTADGKRLVVGTNGNSLEVFDLANVRAPRRISTQPAHTALITRVAISSDGRTVASASIDRSVRLWALGGDGRLTSLYSRRFSSGMFGLAFSPDARLLATNGTDRTTHLLDLRDPRHPREVAALTGSVGTLYAAAFSPNGTTLATAGEDIRLWDIRDPAHPRPTVVIQDFSPAVGELLFTSDSRYLVPMFAGVSSEILDLDTEAVAARVCARVGDPITRDEWNRYLPDLAYKPPCT